MIGTPFRAGRLGVPLRRDEPWYLLPWVFGLMIYVASCCGLGLVVAERTASTGPDPAGATMTLQLPPDTSNARLETVLALLRQTPGIVAVHLLEPAELARLLEPWLGPSPPLAELPVPKLIDLRAAPDGTVDVETLRKQLASIVPGTRVEDYRAQRDGGGRALRRIKALLIGVMLIAFVLVAALAVFVTRSGFAGQQGIIELLHLLGASDRDMVRPFEIRCLELALGGAAIGAIGVVVTMLAMGSSEVAASGLPAAIGLGDWRVWAILAGAAIAGGLIAVASARLTVARRLARMP